jgi:GTP-binding protein
MARRLHASGRQVLVAANKADHPDMDARAAEFEGLGYPVHAISVLHKRGIGDLMDAAVAGLPEATEAARPDPLRVAVVGRPNVGKSSFLNRLLRSDRVLVSDQPGTTRDTVEVPFQVGRGDQARHYLLMDTAGMRRMGKVDTAVERFSLFRAEHTIGHADVVAVVLDAAQGPTTQDKKIVRKVIEHRKGCLLLVNKWDLAMEAKITQRKYGTALREALPHLTFAPVVFMSALSGYNIRKSIEAMDYVASQVSMEIGTGTLNRVLHDAMRKVAPPTVSGRRLKMYYATQTGTKPLRFALFVNNQKAVAPAYRSYLVNALRASFGLEGAPVILQFRNSHEKERR